MLLVPTGLPHIRKILGERISFKHLLFRRDNKDNLKTTSIFFNDKKCSETYEYKICLR
jgi:hypothetical protein